MSRAARMIAIAVALRASVARADPADPATRLTLHDAVATAVAENPRLGMATMTVNAVEADAVEAAGAYDATLDASADATLGRSDPTPAPFAQDLAQDRISASLAITKRMLRGAQVTIRAVGAYSRRDTRIPNEVSATVIDQTTVTPRLELEWFEPVIGGRRSGRAERRALAAGATAARADREAEAARVVRDVERAYWQLHLAEQAVEIQRAAVELAEGQLAIVRAEIEHGARPRLAAAEVEDELGRRREDAVIAEGALAERSLDLARVIGAAPTTTLRTADPPPDGWTAPTAAAVETAIARSPAVAAAVARGDAAAAALDRADDDTGWRVDAYLRASATSESDGTIDALTQAAGYGGVTAELGIKVRIPLGERTRRGAVDGARAELVRARMQVVDAEAELAAAVTRELHRIEVAAARRAALARSVELAATTLEAEQRRWERGDATSFEVLRRQAALGDVRLRAARAIVDGLDARAGLEALTGALLARHGVELW